MASPVTVTIPGRVEMSVPSGSRITDFIYEHLQGNENSLVIAAFVNNDLTSLSYKIDVNSIVEPVFLTSPEGMTVYKRSLCFVLAMATRNLMPGKALRIGHSLGDGYFYHFDNHDHLTEAELLALNREMRRIIDLKQQIRRSSLAWADAIDHFRTMGQEETALILEARNDNKVAVYWCGEHLEIAHGPMAPHTGMLAWFELHPYEDGFVLRFPPAANPSSALPPFTCSRQLYEIYTAYKQCGRILGASSVGQLNRISMTRSISDYIRVTESLQEKNIYQIADAINALSDKVRVVLIAGPSSSGKTTFTKKLAIALRVHGFDPTVISFDDYFVSREQTPRDEKGDYDFEALEAVDVPLLNQHLNLLFEGKEAEIPIFDFRLGHRKEKGRPIRLPERGILLMEGIHGLNPRLVPDIDPSRAFKVYVSALTQLNLDEHNRISTTDNRLIRRMVRDFQFRGHCAVDTIERWPSVRRGEDKNIFPYQDSAQATFNSALDYELAVLRGYAEPLLQTVKPSQRAYHEAMRLLSFLRNFYPIHSKHIPDDSILREFIGDSVFKY